MKVKKYWAGMDVAKRTFDVALAREGQSFPSTPLRDLPRKTFARTEKGASEFITWLERHIDEGERANVRVVMEATGDYSVQLTAWLLKLRASLGPAIETPTRTKAYIDSLGLRNKTDGLDARALAFYGADRKPSPYGPLSPERQELRDLTRYRDALVKERTAMKNRGQERCVSLAVKKMREKRLRQISKDIEKIEEQSKRLIEKTPRFKQDYALLASIDGVGFVTAITVLAELGDLRRFNRARQLTAFAGVSPQKHESGESVRKKTKMCKQGNGRIRQALFLAAMATLRTKKDSGLKRKQQQLCERGKAGKCALGAVMRKLLTIMRAVLISGKPYDPLWKSKKKTTKCVQN